MEEIGKKYKKLRIKTISHEREKFKRKLQEAKDKGLKLSKPRNEIGKFTLSASLDGGIGLNNQIN